MSKYDPMSHFLSNLHDQNIVFHMKGNIGCIMNVFIYQMMKDDMQYIFRSENSYKSTIYSHKGHLMQPNAYTTVIFNLSNRFQWK